MFPLMLSYSKRYFANYQNIPIMCWQLLIVRLINTTSGGVTFFLSLYFINILHFDIRISGIIIAAYGFGTVIGGLIGGRLADILSPIKICIISLLAEAIVFILLSQFHHPIILAILLFSDGVFVYSYIAANSALILQQTNTEEKNKLKIINIMYATSNFGLALSAIIVSVLSEFGFEAIFKLSSLLLFFAAGYLIYLNYKRTTPVWLPNKQTKQNDIDVISDKLHCDEKNRSNKQVMLLALSCQFAIGLILAQLSATYPTYLERAFPLLGIHAVSYLFILNSMLIIFLQAPIVNYAGRFNKLLLMGVGALLLGLGMGMLPSCEWFGLAIIATIIYTIGEMIFYSMAQFACYQSGAKNKKGLSFGLFQSVYASSVVIGPVIGTFLYHHFGGNIIWYLSALIGVGCFIGCYRLKHLL